MSTALSTSTPLAAGSLFDRLARRIFTGKLTSLRAGEVTLHDATGAATYGNAPSCDDEQLQATVAVHRSRFFRRAILGGTLSVAEAYFRGDWDCADLTSLFRIFLRNRNSVERMDAGLTTTIRWGHRFYHWLRRNTRAGSIRNIAAHYDLGNDFYELWLDETLAYSSGVFATPGSTLREASLEKFDRICRRLELSPADHVLEIGTGWGGFALHAAGNYGCRVTSTTISREQLVAAQGRVTAAGLDEQVTLLQQDYRDLRGEFDKLVSIEMIEAVGHRYLGEYFGRCGSLLRDDGRLMLQAIVMPERRHAGYLKSVDFVQRYVFPGGCLPSLAAMLEAAGKHSELLLTHVEDFSAHYAETLRRWRDNFVARLDDVRALGYTEQFIRLWNYYLCYCEAAFAERAVGLLQVQFDKPGRRKRIAAENAANDSATDAAATHLRGAHRQQQPCPEASR